MVDDDDFERLNKIKWYASRQMQTYYAYHTVTIAPNKKAHLKIDRYILNIPKGMFCDHIDGNGLNNQRSNLRVVTSRQNNQNRHINKTSIYPGIRYHKLDATHKTKTWEAKIYFDHKKHYLGSFLNEIDAAAAYRVACKVLFGYDCFEYLKIGVFSSDSMKSEDKPCAS